MKVRKPRSPKASVALPKGAPTRAEFEFRVFPEELDYVRKRRKAQGLPFDDGEVDKPTAWHGLIGLAFSGGGIRSATFNLGVVQALHRWGVFKVVDVMSTVSGGGFIGSCLTSLMSRGKDPVGSGDALETGAGGGGDSPPQPAEFPLAPNPFGGEKPALVHLRNNSNYLAPRGLVDYIWMFAVLVRGIILDFLVLVPFLLIPCAFATWFYGRQLLQRLEYDETVAKTQALVQTTLATRAEEAKAALASGPGNTQEGIEVGNTPVAPFLKAMKVRGFFPLRVLRRAQDLTDALRNPNLRGRDVKEPLVAGSDTGFTQLTFLPQVKLSAVVKRLIDLELLAAPETIEEIWAIEQLLDRPRKDPRRRLGRSPVKPGADGPAGETAGLKIPWEELSVERMLEELRPHLPQPLKPSHRLFMVFVTEESLRQALHDSDLIKCVKKRSGECAWEFTKGDYAQPRLTRALQAFYDRHLFDPEQLSTMMPDSHRLAYTWPDSDGTVRWLDDRGKAQRRTNIAKAARRLWRIVDFSDREALLLLRAAEDDRSFEVIDKEKGPGLSRALKTGGFVPEDSTDFVEAKLPDLPEFLYEQDFYDQDWLGAYVGSRRVEPEHDQRAREIEAARIELDLRSGEALQEFLARLSAAGNAVDGWVALLDSKRWWEPERWDDDIDLPASLRVLLENEGLIRCQGERVGTCEWTAPDKAAEVPELLYEFEFYDRDWFVAYFTKQRQQSVSGTIKGRLKARAQSEPQAVEDKVAYRKSWEVGWRERKRLILEEIARQQLWRQDGDGQPPPSILFRALEATPLGERRPAADFQTKLDRAFKALRKADHLGPPGCDWQTTVIEGPPLPQEESIKERLARLQGKKKTERAAWGEPCEYRTTSFDGAIQALFDMRLFSQLPQGSAYEPPIVEDDGPLIKRWKGFSRSVKSSFFDVSWNPYRLRLPLTQRVAILALAWVLVFPLLSLFARGDSRGGLGKHDFLEKSFGWGLLAIAGVAFFEVQPYLIFRWHYLDLSADWSMAIGAVSVFSAILAGPALTFFKKFGRMIVLAIVAVLGPLLPLVMYLSLLDQLIYNASWQPLAWFGVSLPAIRDGYLLNVGWMVTFFVVAAAAIHLFLLALNPNSTGMHGFYKSRLAKAYLLGETARGDIEGGEDRALSGICPDDSGAPYHLLNVALNLQASDDPHVRDRNSDFFMFSRFYVGGGKNTGYCRTRRMEKLVPELSLGTAMAVSGAAAAPNMGGFTVGPLVILMALLNIRLGYWVPNPRHVRRWAREYGGGLRAWLKYLPARLAGLYRLRPGPYLFLRELLSLIHDKGRCVNVSDGGHLENTAIFELLRRRCRVIIAGDAEADAATNFGGLAALQRLARIDLSTEIRMNTAGLRPENGKSARHFAVGEILYPETAWAGKEIGHLIYLKSALTGDESQVVSEYSGRRPLFPHEPTGDQFFDEGQFEAYRDLGSHSVNSLLKELGNPGPEEVGESEWLHRAVLEWFTARAKAAEEK